MRRKLWIGLALVVAFCACQKLPPVNEPGEAVEQGEEEEGLPPVEGDTSPSLISAEIPVPIGTRVSLTPVGNGLALAWEAGDALRINGELFSIVEEGMTPSKAGFTGKSVSGSSFTVLYPGSYASEQAWDERSYAGQTQSGNASAAHLEWNAKLSGLSRYNSLVFEERDDQEYSQNGVVKFVFTLPDYIESLEAIGLKAPEAVLPLTNSADGERTDELKISLTGFDFTHRDVVAYMMVSAVPVTLNAYTVTLYGPDGFRESIDKEAPEDGLTIGGGYVSVISLGAGDFNEQLFWAGSGIEDDPYQIKTVKHLQNMETLASTPDVFCRLIDDIELTSAEADAFKEINNYWGMLDGADHTISGLTTPLFGNLYGSVKDIDITADISFNGVSNARFLGSDYGLGILAHYAYRDANKNADNFIKNVTVRGSLTSNGVSKNHNYLVGGMLGASNGVPVSGCINYASISVDNMGLGSSATRIGGLVGALQSATTATATDCVNNGTVAVASVTTTGEVSVGGVIGHSGQSVVITNCDNASTGRVSVACNSADITWVSAAGVLASSGAEVKLMDCDNLASITNSTSAAKTLYTAGVVCYLSCTTKAAGGLSITGCNNLGAIVDDSTYGTKVSHWMGGIVCRLDGAAPTDYNTVFINVANCENAGPVSLKAPSVGYARVGGIAAYVSNYALFSGCENKGAVSVSSISTAIHTAGILGETNKGAHLDGVINQGDVYVTGTATSTFRIGGAVGNFVLNEPFSGAGNPRATLENSFNYGFVSAETSNTAPVYFGGLVGGCTTGAGLCLNCTNLGDVSYAVVGGGTLPNLSIGGIAGYYGTAGGELNGNKSNCAVSYSGTVTTPRAAQILGSCGTAGAFTLSNSKLSGSVQETSVTEENYTDFINAYKAGGTFTDFETNSFWAE